MAGVKGIATGVGVAEGEAIGEVVGVVNATVAEVVIVTEGVGNGGVGFSGFTCFVRTCS